VNSKTIPGAVSIWGTQTGVILRRLATERLRDDGQGQGQGQGQVVGRPPLRVTGRQSALDLMPLLKKPLEIIGEYLSVPGAH
jgi:hypothetical protein